MSTPAMDTAAGIASSEPTSAAIGDENPRSHLMKGSATSQAELDEAGLDEADQPPHKKAKVSSLDEKRGGIVDERNTRTGRAPIKAEYLITEESDGAPAHIIDDDAAEGRGAPSSEPSKGDKRRQKQKGQNKAREYGFFGDRIGLCSSRVFAPELSPEQCKHGDGCRFEHDLRRYLKDHKDPDLSVFGGKCPIYEAKGKCNVGFKCRFLASHMGERTASDGRQELFLIEDQDRMNPEDREEAGIGSVNEIPLSKKIELQRRKMTTPRSDAFLKWLEESKGNSNENSHVFDSRAAYIEGSLRPSEKRQLYFGNDTPALAPLTTQGNLPYRRLCVELGAQLTYSEMAMSVPLISGSKQEWALMRAHETETASPKYGSSPRNIIKSYDNNKDLKFAAQISGNKPWNISKATEILTALCPHLRLVDVNCGCPIDLVYENGAGSALMNQPGKLEKMIMGMNAVSGEVPITCKIRMGTKDKEPTALKLVNRLINGPQSDTQDQTGGSEGRTSGVAAITLHGRSRQQRYARSADWSYIADCAALIKSYQEQSDELADTVREPDARDQPSSGKVFFLGNGDCYSHVDYYDHLNNAGVDAVMVARGALVKPWLFEEIEKNQYLDKSASERLTYVEKYVRYGLETWGSDAVGVGTTRRFLLEWLSFAHRYVPIGLLEHLPPSLQDRPPRYRGRSDLETLLASDNYKDWIKISEMFLGPTSEGFKFQPKHKSNSYDYNAEG